MSTDKLLQCDGPMRYRRVRIEGATYFFTVVTGARRPLFADSECVALLDAAFDKVRLAHPFELLAQVVLPDHLHAIWSLPEGDSNFSTRWRLIKEAFTRAYVKEKGAPQRDDMRRVRAEHAIWQHRFWEHVIRDEKDFLNHLDYIHFNPVKHGLATSARDWPFSTFTSWMERGVYEPWWGSDDMPRLPDWVGHE